MSAIALLCILLGARRQPSSSCSTPCSVASCATSSRLSQQLQRIAIGGSLAGRVDSESRQAGAVGADHRHQPSADARRRASVTARGSRRSCSRSSASASTRRCWCTARSFSTPTASSPRLVGVDRADLAGRRLGDLVPPEYAELVHENIRRRLAGEPAAERYEIEVIGLQGQVSRLEITSARVDYEGGSALLVTGRGDHSDADRAGAARSRPSGDRHRPYLLALNSLAEASSPPTREGRITYLESGRGAARRRRRPSRRSARRWMRSSDWSMRPTAGCSPTRYARRSPAARPSTSAAARC